MINREIKVNHDTFGEGIVKDINKGYIEVIFTDNIIKFVFPKVFESLLTTKDDKLKAFVGKKLEEQKRLEAELIVKAENEKKLNAQKEIEITKNSIHINCIFRDIRTVIPQTSGQ